MKQILKYGIYNVATCGTCKCEFAFDTTDIIEKEDGTKVVTCPCCKEEITAPIKE